jgi:hypothetical protein
LGFLEVDFLRVATACNSRGEAIGGIEQPGVAGFSWEQDQRTNGYNPAIVLRGTALNVLNLFVEAKLLAWDRGPVIDQIDHGYHVFRAYWKNAFLKQYEKFSCFLRNELCSNNLRDFGLKKGLDHLDAARQKFQLITDRFTGFQAQSLNVHVHFPLLQRVALPVTIGSIRYPGIKMHDTRMIRLLEIVLHNGRTVGGWTAQQIHEAVLAAFQLSSKQYAFNQFRYDLRKLKGHGLLERDGRRYAYRLTAKGVDVALLFLFFHKRLCGPLAHSRFHHKTDPPNAPNSKLEAAYHKADKAIKAA